MAALLTSEMGNTDKMVGYFTECRELSIPILPPDVNESSKNFTVVDNGIRFGLAAIKNVGGGAVDSILASRADDEPFSSFFDCCCRIDLQKVNKRVIEGLIKVGAFDSMNASRPQLMAIMEQVLEEAASVQKERLLGQTTLFEALAEEAPTTSSGNTWGRPMPNVEEWTQTELLRYERELTGFYISSHPLTQHTEAIRLLSTHTTANLKEAQEGKDVKLCGVIGGIKSTTTKKGNRMAYVQLEDLHGVVEVIVFPELFASSIDAIVPNAVIHITGTVDQMDSGSRIKATKLESLQDVQTKTVKRITLRVSESAQNRLDFSKLKLVLRRHPGPAPISFQFHLATNIQAESGPLPQLTVLPSDLLVNDVEQILGKESVTFH